MTIHTIRAWSCPNVFEAGLPTIAYDHLCDPFEGIRLSLRPANRLPLR